MEKDLFAGVQLMAVKPEEQKKEKVMMIQPNSGYPSYDGEDLKKALTELRDFVAFDMACELCENNSVNAQELSAKLMPLDYLVREVEFKEVEVLV